MKFTLARTGVIFGLAFTLVAGTVACSGPEAADTKSAETITFSVWDTGLTGAIPKALAADKAVQTEFNINVAIRSTPNLPEVYSNLLTGKAEANIGAPESFASMNEKGGKIKISGLVAPNTTAVIGKVTGDLSETLRGKRLAAVTSSGGWSVLSAAIERKYGLKAGKDYEVITVPNTLTGAAQVEAGTADFVMGWEPSVTQTLNKYPTQQVVATPADLGIADANQFVLGVSSDISDEAVGNLLKAINATVEKLKGDPKLADTFGAEQGYRDDTVSRVLASGTLPVNAVGLTAASKASILEDLKIIHQAGGLKSEPSSSIFR